MSYDRESINFFSGLVALLSTTKEIQRNIQRNTEREGEETQERDRECCQRAKTERYN